MDEKLLERYIEGEVTPEEVARVVEWLDTDENNVREFMALHKLHDIAVMNQPGIQNSQEKIASENKKTPFLPIRKIGFEALKIAAIVLLLLGIKTIWKTGEEDIRFQTVYVPVGQRAEITLPDSTKVWLNSRTRLVYPLTFGKRERQVELDGEAYFSVAHDRNKAFKVKTGQVEVRVLGTEFNMVAYSGFPEQQVSLLKGSVELSGKALSGSTYRMKPNENVCLRDGKMKISSIRDYDYFKWKEGLLCFDKETVAAIIKKLELYYDIRIVVENNRFLQERYSGKFRTKDGIEQVLKILQLEHKFTYVKNNDLNLITIK